MTTNFLKTTSGRNVDEQETEAARVERDFLESHIFSKFSGRSPLSHFTEL